MMARGGFTEKELEELNNNPNVLYAEKNKIAYSNAFKHHFMEELNKGKRPQDIFAEAGFDIVALGSKRMERATARWKESYAAGTLGNYDDSNIRQIHAENKRKKRHEYEQETIALQNTKIRDLTEKIATKDKEIAVLKKRISALRIENNLQKTLPIYKESDIINFLKAKIELLQIVGFLEKEKYNYDSKDRTVFYDLINNIVAKYDIKRGVSDLCDALGIGRYGYRSYMNKIAKGKQDNNKG